jgi:GINS complex subunit 4
VSAVLRTPKDMSAGRRGPAEAGRRRPRPEEESTASPGSSDALTDDLGLSEALMEETVRDEGVELNEDVIALRSAYINEKASPEIMPFEEELVVKLLALVRDQVRGVAGREGVPVGEEWCSGGAGGGVGAQEAAIERMPRTSRMVYVRALYSTDVDRVRYLLAAYLRCRLFKIRNHAAHLWTLTELRRTRLSKEENEFLREIIEAQFGHWKMSGLAALPKEYGVESVVKDPEVRRGPSLRSYVLARAHEETTVTLEHRVRRPDGSESGTELRPISMPAGGVILVRYDSIRDKLFSHEIDLI